jgi:hypothetical protein
LPDDFIAKIFKGNSTRLIKSISEYKSKDANADATGLRLKNLRDIETLISVVEAQKELHSTQIYSLCLEFVRGLLESTCPKILKRAFSMMEAALGQLHYTYCLDLFQIMKNFYNTKMTVAAKVVVVGAAGSAGERLSKNTIAKLQPIILSFLTRFFDCYFTRRIDANPTRKLKQETLESIISELNEMFEDFFPLSVILIKQRSHKTRKIAKDFLNRLDEVYEKALGDPTSFLNIVLAGLAGKTSTMKASTILSVAIIWTKRLDSLDRNYVGELLEVILLLVKEKNKETYNAIISFLKAFIKSAAKDLVSEKLGMIMQAIFVWDKTSQMLCKGRVKNLLIKLLKRFDMSQIETLIPEEHANLLKGIQKMKRREAAKKKDSRTFSDGAPEESWLDDNMKTEDFQVIKRQSRRKKVEEIEDDMEDIEMANPYAANGRNIQEKPEVKNLLLKFDQNVIFLRLSKILGGKFPFCGTPDFEFAVK